MATKNQLNVDPVLSNVSIQYKNSEMSYVSEKIFPVVPVDNDTGIYYTYDRSIYRAENDTRGAGSAANVVDFNLSQSTYGPILDHALKARITDEDREIAGKNGVDLESDTTEFLTHLILLNKEKDFYSTVTNTSVIPAANRTTLSGTSQWSDYGNSDPITNVQTWKDAVKSAVGLVPNTLMLSYDVYSMLLNHPAFLERRKYTALGIVDTTLLSQVFQIPNVVVADAQENTALEGQTDSMSYIFSKKAWLFYVTSRPGKKTVSAGYTLRHDIGGLARQVERWRDPNADMKQDWFMCSYRYQHKLMATSAIYYAGAVIA